MTCSSIDMIGAYQPLIINTFHVKKVVQIKTQLFSHDRVVSLLIEVSCGVSRVVHSSENKR